MISWLGEKLRHWAEVRRREADTDRRIAEHRANPGRTVSMVLVAVHGGTKIVRSDDPEYPPDRFPPLRWTTECGTAMTSGSGEGRYVFTRNGCYGCEVVCDGCDGCGNRLRPGYRWVA